MKEWYELTQGLETTILPLDELSSARIEQRVKDAVTSGGTDIGKSAIRAERQTQAPLPRRRRRLLPAIALIAVLLLSACGYIAISQYSHWFWNYAENPHFPEQSEDLLASMGTVIDQSQTAGGVTVTLHGALLDTDTILLSLSLEGDGFPNVLWSSVQSDSSWLYLSEAQAKENWAKSMNMTEEEAEAYFEEHRAQLQEWHRPDDMTYIYNRQTDTYSLQVEDAVPFDGDELELTLHLEHLSIQHRVGQELQTHTVEGPFEFTFTVERKEVRQVWFGDYELPLTEEVSVRVDKISVSPFHVEVEFTGTDPLAVDSRGTPILESAGCDITDFRLTGLRIAGEEIGITSERSSSAMAVGPDGSWNGSATKGPLSRIIDPATVEAVKVNDTWLELKYADPMELNDAK